MSTLKEQAGLIRVGAQWMGTQEQWDEATRLEDEEEREEQRDSGKYRCNMCGDYFTEAELEVHKCS